MQCCKKCGMMCGILLLVFGVLFLLKDLGYWTFWSINWWTIAFLLIGIGGVASGSCKECCKKK